MKPQSLGMTDDFFLRHPELQPQHQAILAAAQLLLETYRNGGKLLVCGNGGSSADADHIVGELMKGFLLRRPLPPELGQRLEQQFGEEGKELAEKLQCALPAIALNTQNAFRSAFDNDVDPKLCYAQQVLGYGRPGDCLLGISTSGNAKNVLAAVQTARVLGLRCLCLTGAQGGQLAPLCDISILAPSSQTYRVQEQHLAIYHLLCALVEQELFDC